MKKSVWQTSLVLAWMIFSVLFFASGVYFASRHWGVDDSALLSRAREEAKKGAYYVASRFTHLLISCYPDSHLAPFAYVKKAEFEEKAELPGLAYWTYQERAKRFDEDEEPSVARFRDGRLAFEAEYWGEAIENFRMLKAEFSQFSKMGWVNRFTAQAYFEISELTTSSEKNKRESFSNSSLQSYLKAIQSDTNTENVSEYAQWDFMYLERLLESGRVNYVEQAVTALIPKLQSPDDQLVGQAYLLLTQYGSRVGNKAFWENAENVVSRLLAMKTTDAFVDTLTVRLGLALADEQYVAGVLEKSYQSYEKILNKATSENRAWILAQLADLSLRTERIERFQKWQSELKSHGLGSVWYEQNFNLFRLFNLRHTMQQIAVGA